MENPKQLRKLQLSGGSTFIISLPKGWVEDLGSDVGDEIYIIKNSNKSFTILPKSNIEEKKKKATLTISQKDSPESLRRKIIAVYLAGYKMIRVGSKGMRIFPEHSRTIKNLVRSSMIGTEIVESSSENITIQILTRLPELSFETALKRMHLMTENMHKEAIQAFLDFDTDQADEVVNMDDEVDRFSLYMRRNLTVAVENASLLNDMGLQKPSDCLGYRAVISRIERIADHAVLIAKRVKFLEEKVDIKWSKRILNLSDESLNSFQKSVEALLSKNYSLAEKVAEHVNSIIQREKEMMELVQDSSKNSTVIRFVLEDIRRTAEYSGDIAEVAIDGNIHSIISEK